MKAVLISIQPKWVEKICSGEKTIEVRKTRPKLETPFKCYIYCTKDNQHYDLYINENSARDVYGNFSRLRAGKDEVVETVSGFNTFIAHGKVIGEFVCDRIDEFHAYELEPSKRFYDFEKERLDLFLKKSCLSYEEVCEYRKDFPYIKPLYAWHISDLKIYDKPKELSEFKAVKVIRRYQKKEYDKFEKLSHAHRVQVTYFDRPPQSWRYVEEKDNG